MPDEESTALLALDDKDVEPSDAQAKAKKALDPWTWANLAILSSYFCVGFGMSFIGTPLTYYCIDELYASAEQQNVVSVVMSLPWSFKVLYGFLSDGVPIRLVLKHPSWSFFLSPTCPCRCCHAW